MEEWIKVAEDLCSGLDNDINDVAERLKNWANEHNFDREDVTDLCWIDSTWMFNQIYK